MIKTPQMRALLRVRFFPVSIPDQDHDLARVPDALRPISNQMSRGGLFTTPMLGGILPTLMGKRVKPPFGLNERISFQTYNV